MIGEGVSKIIQNCLTLFIYGRTSIMKRQYLPEESRLGHELQVHEQRYTRFSKVLPEWSLCRNKQTQSDAEKQNYFYMIENRLL